MPISRSTGLIVAAAAALVLLPNLGGPPLWDDDEPRNAACSVAMHASGDWIVPTFNGRLRVEKPALINWLHLAGFAVAGVNETGARLASAMLTIGTCVLTAMVAASVCRPDVGIWAGLVMATCLWTGVSGRAATPDAALAFCTTLALWLFVRGGRRPLPDGTGWRDAPVQLSGRSAALIGAACGMALLAKGPVGLALPLGGLALFAVWQALRDPGRTGPLALRLVRGWSDAARGLRMPVIVLAAAMTAAPWYAAVTISTDGEWLRQFFFVHNVGRFAAPMEGHSGPALLYYPIVLLVGMFPWSMASALVVGHAATTSRTTVGMRLMTAWILAWVVPFSLSGTKLPGYVWPAYPAIATAVGLFIADWIRLPTWSTDRWMRVAWCSLAASGVALTVGLPIVAGHIAPGSEWLGLIGLLPMAGACAAWASQTLGSRIAASSVWAATATATVGLLLACGPAAVAHVGGSRQLISSLPSAVASPVPIASLKVPASAVFYAGRIATQGTVQELSDPTAAATFVAENPGAHLVINARFEEQVSSVLPDHYGVLRTAASFPTAREVLLIGPKPAERLATMPQEQPR